MVSLFALDLALLVGLGLAVGRRGHGQLLLLLRQAAHRRHALDELGAEQHVGVVEHACSPKKTGLESS